MQRLLKLKSHRLRVRSMRNALIAGIFSISVAHAQDTSWQDHPWVHNPSAGMTAKFRNWRLVFEDGKRQSAPEKGVFRVFGRGLGDGIARLVREPASPPSIQLMPVAKRIRYVPRGEQHTDPADRDVTSEMIKTLHSPEVVKFVEQERLNNAHLDVEKNFSVALVQDFEVALRTPGRKEHVWSINWRVERQTETSYDGYEAWGLFTAVGGALRPFYLAGRVSNGETPSVSYYYVLATGDLNGDGIDEIVADEMGFEKEQDDLQLWAWEGGAPVTIRRMPWH